MLRNSDSANAAKMILVQDYKVCAARVEATHRDQLVLLVAAEFLAALATAACRALEGAVPGLPVSGFQAPEMGAILEVSGTDRLQRGPGLRIFGPGTPETVGSHRFPLSQPKGKNAQKRRQTCFIFPTLKCQRPPKILFSNAACLRLPQSIASLPNKTTLTHLSFRGVIFQATCGRSLPPHRDR